MTDCHVHTNFSPDGFCAPETTVKAAINKGVKFLAVTDHLDFDPKYRNALNESNIGVYFDSLTGLKRKYADKISLAVGIEAGYTKENATRIADILARYKFDYIINSVHKVDGTDCYFKGYFKNKSKRDAYTAYFEEVLESLDAPYNFDAVGHLGYVERKAPYHDPEIRFSEFSGIIDKILTKIIKKDKILEINTNVPANYSVPVCLPREDTLIRYKFLGGKKVAFASDAHKPERILDKYGTVAALSERLGLKLFTGE